jgi:deazaflavin-dependent oxidoreductase (nitroreductase family)
LPSHCCPTPCIQASITLTLEAVTVAHQRGFWRRGRPVAIRGDDRDPDWYRNLTAQPDIELTMAGQRRPMRVRRASPQEKAELWPQVVAAYTAGPLSGESAARQGEHTAASRFRPIRRRPRNPRR